MNSDDAGEGHALRTWVLRVVAVAGIIAAFLAVGYFVKKRQAAYAIPLLFTVIPFAYMLSRNWTGSLFSGAESAKRYVDGVEGQHRHEWYAFKGQRVRVWLDAKQQPWFAVRDIAGTLDLNVDKTTFRAYGLREHAIPESASEACLSEQGLRRLIKNSKHGEAGALALWLERDVLRVLRNRNEGLPVSVPIRDE